MKENIPLGPRAGLNADLLRFLESQYALRTILSSQDLGGAYNLNVSLNTAKGRYVARVHRPWVPPGRLKAVHAVKGWLKEQGLPTVLPLPTIHGETFALYGDRLVEVEPYMPHARRQDGWEAYEQAFHLLGQLHRALTRYPQPQSFPPPLVENYRTPDVLRRWTAETLQRLHQADGPGVQQAVSLAEKALRILEPLQEQWVQGKNKLPFQFIHGDYGIGNLLWANGKIIAILDFDFLADHERVFEIAYALYWMFMRLKPELAVQDWPWRKAARLIDLYNTENSPPLSREERLVLPLEMSRVPLYWIAEAAYLEDPVGAVLSQAKGLAVSEWLVDHSDSKNPYFPRLPV